MKVYRENGSTVVEHPPERLLEVLTRFRRQRDVSGFYEPLYTISREYKTLVTLPGFAPRICALAENGDTIVDRRLKLPDVDPVALDGLDSVWRATVETARAAGGGIVSVPDLLGISGVASALIRSYPRDRLAERGTPICLVACDEYEQAKALMLDLRQRLPDRDVGSISSDSEDVLVTTFSRMRDVSLRSVGVLIGVLEKEPLKDRADAVRASAISSVRNAARWGILSSPIGGPHEPSLIEEGLFGPLVASASYSDAVKAGVGRPVTVCWLPTPRPEAPLLSAPLGVLARLAHAENRRFVQLLADIVRQTAPDSGCVVKADSALVAALGGQLPGVVRIDKRTAEYKAQLSDLSAGIIRKALVDANVFPRKLDQALVVCSCGGADSVYNIPWGAKTKEAPDRKLYMVDFRHDWDS